MAVLVGFIGIIIISEPGYSSLNLFYIYPIVFCLGLSYVAITIRQLSTTEPVWLIGLFFSISILIISIFSFALQGWVSPNLKDLFLLSMVGILGGLANLWLTQSYKYSEVSLVTPLKYLALVFAIIFGYIFWDEIPTIKTLFGAALVIISSTSFSFIASDPNQYSPVATFSISTLGLSLEIKFLKYGCTLKTTFSKLSPPGGDILYDLLHICTCSLPNLSLKDANAPYLEDVYIFN